MEISQIAQIRTFREFLEALSDTPGVALIDAKTEAEISYANLSVAVHDLAARLPMEAGERVVLYELSQLDWVVSFFAVQLRGGIAVPIDERVHDTFIEKVLKDVAPSLVLTDVNNPDLFSGFHTATVEEYVQKPAVHTSVVQTDPDDPCEIIFTSGTWSDPKGVVLSQRNILANVSQILSVYPDKEPGVILGILPLSHAYQQTLGLFAPLSLGSTIVFLKVTNSFELLATIKKYNATVIPLVPRVLELLYASITRKVRNKRVRSIFVRVVRAARFLPRPLRRALFFFVHAEIGGSLTTFVSGGAPLGAPIDTFFQGLGYKVMVGYGLSECAPIVAAHCGQYRTVGEVGHPLPGVSVRLGEDGEVIVSGDNVFLGYWPNHGTSEELATGDLAHQTKQGSLILKGRNKNLIVFDSGEKCFCEDLELVVSELDAVEMVCVIEKSRDGVTHAECLVGTGDPHDLSETQMRTHVASRMPMGVTISRYVFVTPDAFPVTHTLKPNRAKISELLD